uniref:GAG-pre-integrase domain-containing protein n=1 Tax=Fagus sylvatica TaxID=28930 RepID=A0A2N9IJB8_FAGSY
MGQTIASGIWRVILNRYTSISRSSIVNLKRELHSIKKNSDSVTQYLQKIKEARDKLVSVGVFIDDEEIPHIVLQGLPSDFHSFTSAMLTKNEAVRFEELHTLMKTEEDLLKSAMDNSKEIAHMAMGWHPSAKLATMVTAAPPDSNQTTWISNTGATDHFTPDLHNIPDNHAYTNSQLVSVGNGNQLPISHIGNSQLRTSAYLFNLRKIQDHLMGKPLYKGFSKDGLYPIHGLSLPSLKSRLSPASSHSSTAVPSSFSAPHVSYTACRPFVCSKVSEASLWHMRLGHP